jgi:hypothetical protein
MAEEKKQRTMDEIGGEYQQLCVRAGDLQYKIRIFGKDLDTINKQLEALNFEAAAVQAESLKKAEEAKKAAEAAAPAPAPAAPALKLVEEVKNG